MKGDLLGMDKNTGVWIKTMVRGQKIIRRQKVYAESNELLSTLVSSETYCLRWPIQ